MDDLAISGLLHCTELWWHEEEVRDKSEGISSPFFAHNDPTIATASKASIAPYNVYGAKVQESVARRNLLYTCGEMVKPSRRPCKQPQGSKLLNLQRLFIRGLLTFKDSQSS